MGCNCCFCRCTIINSVIVCYVWWMFHCWCRSATRTLGSCSYRRLPLRKSSSGVPSSGRRGDSLCSHTFIKARSASSDFLFTYITICYNNVFYEELEMVGIGFCEKIDSVFMIAIKLFVFLLSMVAKKNSTNSIQTCGLWNCVRKCWHNRSRAHFFLSLPKRLQSLHSYTLWLPFFLCLWWMNFLSEFKLCTCCNSLQNFTLTILSPVACVEFNTTPPPSGCSVPLLAAPERVQRSLPRRRADAGGHQRGQPRAWAHDSRRYQAKGQRSQVSCRREHWR